MNCFFKIDGTVYTAPTVGTVLPGVTRMSCIELLKHWGIPVSEERLQQLFAVVRRAVNIGCNEKFHAAPHLPACFGTSTMVPPPTTTSPSYSTAA